jgi:hypothetical protein
MKPFIALTILFLPLAASADQITVTLVNQTLSTSAQVHLPYPGGDCYNFGVASASCSIGGVTASAYIGTEPYSNTGIGLRATGAYGTDQSGAYGSAYVSGTLNVAGGSGTGYLEILPSYSGANQIAGAAIFINNQEQIVGNLGPFWTLIPFTAGQPIHYAFDVWSNYAIASLSIYDVRVYGHQPSGCVYGQPCTDPDYLDITSLFTPNSVSSGSGSSISQVPEPSTVWIAGLGLSALVLFRPRPTLSCNDLRGTTC